MEKKEYNANYGGARTGAGRPKGSKNKTPAQGRKKIFYSITLSGTQEEIEAIKSLAEKNGKSASRYVIDTILNK